jgi:hypothetical protein
MLAPEQRPEPVEGRWTMKRVFLILTILTLAVLAGGEAPQAQGGYELTYWTVDGGGAESSGGAYTLGGTIGQPDAGLLTGVRYTLGGGLWGGGALAGKEYRVYLTLVLKDYP